MHGELQRDPGGLGQHPGQRRQREVVTRGDAQAQSRPLLGSSLRGAELDREPGQDPREPLRGSLLRPEQLRAGRGEARAAAALEQHQRRAELPLVVAQQSPGRAVGNAAGRDRRGKRRRGRDRFQQRQQAVVERFDRRRRRGASAEPVRASLCKYEHILAASHVGYDGRPERTRDGNIIAQSCIL